MPKPGSLKARLRKADIRHFDQLIHDQPKDWLIKNFSKRADEYPVNVSMLIRNIVWQIKERIAWGEKPPYRELVRTFWYSYVKPTLARADSLSKTRDQYKDLVETLVEMVKKHRVIRYKDIGFRDDKQGQRIVGGSANIILFSEKSGHQDFLFDMSQKYSVSVFALGGQPSVLNVEYFVDELKKANLNLQRSFYLFSIVDYDPSGWIIRNAFINDLKFYGIPNMRVIDLVDPDMLSPKEIKISRVPIPAESKDTITKNKNWLTAVYKRRYKNQHYLEQRKIRRGKIERILYGLEAEAISIKRYTEKLEKVMVPLLGKSEDLLKTYELKKLYDLLGELILDKMRG